jgi:hypothetical protein
MIPICNYFGAKGAGYLTILKSGGPIESVFRLGFR